MKSHALFSPSSSSKWLNCANAVTVEKDQPKDESSSAALAGTARHELAEMCLTYEENANVHFGFKLPCGLYADDDMVDDVNMAVEMVKDLIREYGSYGYKVAIELEVTVPIDHITNEAGATGSADVVLVCTSTKGNVLVVVDYKFGFHAVDVAHNTQLMMYASGALKNKKRPFDQVVLAIAQPKVSSKMQTWSTSPHDIDSWRLNVARPAAKTAQTIYLSRDRLLKANFGPGVACKWCRAKAVCPALLETVKETISADFEDLSKDDAVLLLSDIELGELYPQLDLVSSWVSSVKGRVLSRMTNGHAVPGLKLVAGKRGRRAWLDDQVVEEMLKKLRFKSDKMYSKKLLGPKPILDLVANNPRLLKKLQDFVIQPEGQPSVAFEKSNKEEVFASLVIDDFENEDLITVAVICPDDYSDLM